ncbi:MAG: N-acetylneuraminate synthase family protein [Acidobacteriota bacterium]
MQDWFSDNNRNCLIVAEVAQAHDGSLGTAHAYIDAAASAGADAVKFQTHIAAAESTPGEPWRVKFSRQDATRYDYWRRMEFAEEQWIGLAAHAEERGLIFLSSAFSFEAVELLERVGVPAWKVGAGETSNIPLLEKMAATGKPIILSSGMSGWEELDAAVGCVRSSGAPVAVLQCTTAYPCPPEKIGLNVIGELRQRYNCPVGLSDHSGTIYAGFAAATLGANIIEVHITFSRQGFGPDVPASIPIKGLKQLVAGVRFIERIVRNPVDKQAMAESFAELRQVFGKSVVAARNLEAGHHLTISDLAFKKPGTGIPAARYREVLNRQLRRDVVADTLFSEEDFE